MSELEQLLQKAENLADALMEQTQAIQLQGQMIQKLAESNAELVAALAEFMADEMEADDGGPGGPEYLSDVIGGD